MKANIDCTGYGQNKETKELKFYFTVTFPGDPHSRIKIHVSQDQVFHLQKQLNDVLEHARKDYL